MQALYTMIQAIIKLRRMSVTGSLLTWPADPFSDHVTKKIDRKKQPLVKWAGVCIGL